MYVLRGVFVLNWSERGGCSKLYSLILMYSTIELNRRNPLVVSCGRKTVTDGYRGEEEEGERGID